MTTIAVSYNLPFYFVAIYAYARGIDAIRIPTLLWAVFLSTFLIAMIAEQKWGEYKSKAFDKLLVPYAIFVFVPWIVFARVWSKHPFTTRATPTSSKKD